MAGPDRTELRRQFTRGLTFLGLAVAVLGPFGLLVAGIESGRADLAAVGLVLVVFVVAVVLRRRPPTGR